MKKALVIGINEYEESKLTGCVNDAKIVGSLLEFNDDKTHNCDVKYLLDKDATKLEIISSIQELYKNDDEFAILYFSGHGADNINDGAIISADLEMIPFKEIMKIIERGRIRYNIVILDCCYSGKFANESIIGDKTILGNNTIILTACNPNEPAADDINTKHGTFTNLLIGALKGGAGDILGRITPGSIYSYIDQALGSWEQRPYFKANVSTFVSLRNSKVKIEMSKLKEGMKLFETNDFKYQLDPSYEDTNVRRCKEHKAIKPYAKKENVAKFKVLQKLNQNGLVAPIDEEFMYFAAMNSKKVELTELGKHYWNLCHEGRI